MYENTPSDRVQFRALGELPVPGACLICGSGTRDEGYVDLGAYIEYVGAALLCAYCVTQVGECLGMLTNNEAQAMREQMANLLADKQTLEATVDDLNERLSAYSVITQHTSDPSLNFNGLSREDFNQSTESITVRSDSGESETKESTSGDGELASVGAAKPDNGSKPEPELFEL